jgi:hypothetical protein
MRKEIIHRKYFQIKMDPAAHGRMKFRAKQLGVSIGEYLENLIGSMEIRLKQAYETTKIQEHLIDELMLRVLLKNNLSLNAMELKAELDIVRVTTSTTAKTSVADYEASITVYPGQTKS